MRTYIIYKYTSPSGKYYIGQTYNEHMRKYFHKYDATRGKTSAFYNAIRKYGFENFKYEVIVRDVPHYLVNAFERYWIWYYKANTEGYNSTIGGDGMTAPTDAVRKKISEAGKGKKHTEDAKKAISTKLLGKTKTDIHKQNMRKPKSAEHAAKVGKARSRKVVCLETGTIYASVQAANLALGFDRKNGNIPSVCRGRRKTAGGYHWAYATKDDK